MDQEIQSQVAIKHQALIKLSRDSMGLAKIQTLTLMIKLLMSEVRTI